MGIAALIGQGVDTVLDRTVVAGYSRLGLAVRRRLPTWPADVAEGALTGRSAVVTGASSGLGAATVEALAGFGATVHLVVRDLAKGERIVAGLPDASRLRVWRCDVSDLDDVSRLAEQLGEQGVDVVVHNAGTMPAKQTASAQGHEIALATHVLGPLRLTELLRPALRASADARVIWVSSGGMYTQRLPIDDPEYLQGEFSGTRAYARTKRVQVSLVPVLARRWAADGIAVHAMHPGWADTPGVARSLPGFRRITRPILRDSAEGADTVVWLAAVEPPPPSGLFWHDRRSRPAHLLPWTDHDESTAEAMFQWCADAAKVAS
ncbi:MAG: SDR family NAD(P)-dependent oxidoreductase [Kibdelosporangium sp.]